MRGDGAAPLDSKLAKLDDKVQGLGREMNSSASELGGKKVQKIESEVTAMKPMMVSTANQLPI